MLTNSTIPSTILVVGGAGYIGSHMLLMLQRAGYAVVVLDNLSKGHRDAIGDVEFVMGDMNDTPLLKQLFIQYPISAVMHFASFIEVGESVQFPGIYYRNNVVATLNLIEVMVLSGIKNLIFSSSAAVYGPPYYSGIPENHPLAPNSPYGRSKWMIEEIIKDYAQSSGLHYAILRYFNAAGADPEGRVSEKHQPESHLIPLILQVAAGRSQYITVYGQNYPTSDGTCIRDYVHVVDLCEAHLLALEALFQDKKNLIYNLGAGRGHSVLQVIQSAQRITGKNISAQMGLPRSGDVPILVADVSLAKKELDWIPKYSDLDTIISTAWQVFSSF